MFLITLNYHKIQIREQVGRRGKKYSVLQEPVLLVLLFHFQYLSHHRSQAIWLAVGWKCLENLVFHLAKRTLPGNLQRRRVTITLLSLLQSSVDWGSRASARLSFSPVVKSVM
jgi:hypothetical protein